MADSQPFGRREIALVFIALAWFYAASQFLDAYAIMPVLFLLAISSIVAGQSPLSLSAKQRLVYLAPALMIVLATVGRAFVDF